MNEPRLYLPSLSACNSSSLFNLGPQSRRRKFVTWMAQRYEVTVVAETHGADDDQCFLPQLPQHHLLHSQHATEARATGAICMAVAKSMRWTQSLEVIFPVAERWLLYCNWLKGGLW